MTTSRSHLIAFIQQDNGELVEDVVVKELVDDRRQDAPDHLDQHWSDEQLADEQLADEDEDSFPASDPPSHWAGQDTKVPHDPAELDRKTAGRIVDSVPVEEVPERSHPGAPVPGTLPRQ